MLKCYNKIIKDQNFSKEKRSSNPQKPKFARNRLFKSQDEIFSQKVPTFTKINNK